MSLKPKIEALIYAAEEPITPDQMVALLKEDLLALKNAADADTAQQPGAEEEQARPAKDGAVLEFARNVLGCRNAEHAETNPRAALPLISRLTCSLVERSGRVMFAEGSGLRAAYGTSEVDEPYHCNYGLNPAYAELLAGGALRVSGRDPAGEVRAVELDDHPFFVASQYHPEFNSRPNRPEPLFREFVGAAATHAGEKPADEIEPDTAEDAEQSDVGARRSA